MTALKQCEFFVVRYMPNVIRQEFVNVGVVLLEAGGEGFTGIRFTRDWRRVRCLDPLADIDLLVSYEEELLRLLQSRMPEVINYRGPMSRRDWLLGQFEQFSGALQLGPVNAVLSESPRQDLARLAHDFLESEQHGQRAVSGRRLIFNALRDAFTAAGVWESPQLRKNIPVSDFAEYNELLKDDPLKIDCAYRPNGVLHLFQAQSLLSDAVDSAKALIFSYTALRDAVNAHEAAETDLTVITETDVNRAESSVSFALHLLAHDETIRTVTVADLPAVAEQARVELGL